MRPPLWLTVEGTGATVTVSLATCRNCGKVKIASNPCGFDHLAAIIEFCEKHPEVGDAVARALAEVP